MKQHGLEVYRLGLPILEVSQFKKRNKIIIKNSVMR